MSVRKDEERGVIYFGGYPISPERSEACSQIEGCISAEASVGLGDVWPEEKILDFSLIDDFLAPWIKKGKKGNIRVFTAHNCTFFSPRWMFENRDIRLIHEGYFLEDIKTLPFSTRGKAAVEEKGEYLVQFDFAMEKHISLELSLITPLTEEKKTREISLEIKEKGLKQIYFEKEDHHPSYIEIRSKEGGHCSIANLHIGKVSDSLNKNTGFPDYFSPSFQDLWRGFVEKLADRYGDDPHIDTVSIGGFGRWEELILDTDEMGRYDRQWLSCGYTDRRYMDLIMENMDLFQKHFPRKNLEIQLAYGLDGISDKTLTYRRIGMEAVRRGIFLKQNGLSEKYDAWEGSDNTQASWMFNRLRFNENTMLTHETGGQMYNNYFDVMGHPIALMNRGLINGMDFLYLYDLDILQPQVNKYFQYACMQMGREHFNRFYCLPGHYPLPMMNWNGPMVTDFYNLWLGIRLYEPPFHVHEQTIDVDGRPVKLGDGMADYKVIEGEKCAESDINGHLFFDVDQRYKYHSMYNPYFRIDYFDEGKERFSIWLLNGKTGDYELLKRKQGTGSGCWKRLTLAAGERLTTSRNDGEDDHIDLIITGEGKRPVAIKSVQLDFVPAASYAREEACRVPVSDTGEFLLTSDVPPAFLSIPLDSEDMDHNRVSAEVFIREDKGWKSLAEKELVGFAHGDCLEIPLPPCYPGENRFKISFSVLKGQCGWTGPDGKNRWVEVKSYRYESKKLEKSNGETVIAGIKAGQGVTNLEIVRHEGSHYRRIIKAESETGLFYFPPLPAGSYQFLSQGEEIKPEKIFSLIKRKSSVKDERFGLGAEGFVIEGGNLSMEESKTLSIERKAEKTDQLKFILENRSSSPMLRVIWNEKCPDDGSAWIPVVPNDNQKRTYTFPIGLEDKWSDTINTLVIKDGLL